MAHPKERLSLNVPSCIKTRFAYGFLRALKRLNKHQPCAREICCRYRLVKIAADESMASAVGSGRAWSRAMLSKIHNSRRRRASRSSTTTTTTTTTTTPTAHGHGHGHGLRKRFVAAGKGKGKGKELCGLFRANELRKLVPGGKTMDLHCLLDETAHYIKCLTTQVQVMRNIAEYSCSTT